MENKYVKGFAHVGLDAVDTKKCAQFFIDNLGFESLFTEAFGDGFIELIGNGSCVIEIVPAEKDHKPHGQVNHFAIEVSDVDAVMAQLKDKGIVFEGDPLVLEGFFGRGVKAAFCEGPEGMRIELCQYLS